MKIKQWLSFLAAYFVITMAWAYVLHVVWFADAYALWGAVTRSTHIIPLGIIATLIQGAVIGYLYPFYRGRGTPIMRGIKFNLIIGLMVYSAMAFGTAAKFQIAPLMPFLTYHTVFQFIQFGLTGAALGWICRR